MDKLEMKTGILGGGLPFARFGKGAQPLAVFPGLADAAWDATSVGWNLLEHYRRFTEQFTVFVISRKRGLPQGYTTRDMAADYATAFDHELGPCPVLGISLGGCIAQHFAADYPERVHRLVLASAGYQIDTAGRKIPEHWLELAGKNRWKEFYFNVAKVTVQEFHHTFYQFLLPLLRMNAHDPHDFLVALAASLQHNSSEILGKICTPTLVVAGAEDIFFPPVLLRETVRRIPNSRLHLITNARHDAYESQRNEFETTVLGFLSDHESPSPTVPNLATIAAPVSAVPPTNPSGNGSA